MSAAWWLTLVIGNAIGLVAATLAPNHWRAAQPFFAAAALVYVACGVWLVTA